VAGAVVGRQLRCRAEVDLAGRKSGQKILKPPPDEGGAIAQDRPRVLPELRPSALVERQMYGRPGSVEEVNNLVTVRGTIRD
jgi:hypothetical protein